MTREEFLHIAKLANINLSEEEVEKLMPQLASVFDYFKTLDEVDTSKITPMSRAESKNNNRFQEGDQKTLNIDDTLKNANKVKDRYILTDAVLQ